METKSLKGSLKKTSSVKKMLKLSYKENRDKIMKEMSVNSVIWIGVGDNIVCCLAPSSAMRKHMRNSSTNVNQKIKLELEDEKKRYKILTVCEEKRLQPTQPSSQVVKYPMMGVVVVEVLVSFRFVE